MGFSNEVTSTLAMCLQMRIAPCDILTPPQTLVTLKTETPSFKGTTSLTKNVDGHIVHIHCTLITLCLYQPFFAYYFVRRCTPTSSRSASYLSNACYERSRGIAIFQLGQVACPFSFAVFRSLSGALCNRGVARCLTSDRRSDTMAPHRRTIYRYIQPSTAVAT